MRGSPCCVIALYLQDDDLVRSFCKKRIQSAAGYPIVKHILNGNWAVSSHVAFDIEIKCIVDNKPENYRTSLRAMSAGVSMLTLNLGCSARSEYFTLPVYTAGEHSVEIETKFWDKILIPNKLPNMWEGSSDLVNYKRKQVEHVPHLGPIAELPLDYLQSIIHEQMNKASKNQMIVQKNSILKKMFIITAVVLTIISIGLIGLVLLCKKMSKIGYYKPAHDKVEFQLVKLRENDSENECVNEREGNDLLPPANAENNRAAPRDTNPFTTATNLTPTGSERVLGHNRPGNNIWCMPSPLHDEAEASNA